MVRARRRRDRPGVLLDRVQQPPQLADGLAARADQRLDLGVRVVQGGDDRVVVGRRAEDAGQQRVCVHERRGSVLIGRPAAWAVGATGGVGQRLLGAHKLVRRRQPAGEVAAQ